jgi:hypothetical protein
MPLPTWTPATKAPSLETAPPPSASSSRRKEFQRTREVSTPQPPPPNPTKRRSEPSCKPGPVSPPRRRSGGGGHSSRPRVAAGLERAYPGARRATAAARGGAPLFALAPGGACRAIDVTADAVRSCRTVSPLPASRRAVCSLWRCPASRLGWPLASTLPCGARTFLPRVVSAGVRPDGSDPERNVTLPPERSIRTSAAAARKSCRFPGRK